MKKGFLVFTILLLSLILMSSCPLYAEEINDAGIMPEYPFEILTPGLSPETDDTSVIDPYFNVEAPWRIRDLYQGIPFTIIVRTAGDSIQIHYISIYDVTNSDISSIDATPLVQYWDGVNDKAQPCIDRIPCKGCYNNRPAGHTEHNQRNANALDPVFLWQSQPTRQASGIDGKNWVAFHVNRIYNNNREHGGYGMHGRGGDNGTWSWGHQWGNNGKWRDTGRNFMSAMAGITPHNLGYPDRQQLPADRMLRFAVRIAGRWSHGERWKPAEQVVCVYVGEGDLPKGSGWYYGDQHVHNWVSDGWVKLEYGAPIKSEEYLIEYGQPAYCHMDCAQKIGLDYLIFTDHSCFTKLDGAINPRLAPHLGLYDSGYEGFGSPGNQGFSLNYRIDLRQDWPYYEEDWYGRTRWDLLLNNIGKYNTGVIAIGGQEVTCHDNACTVRIMRRQGQGDDPHISIDLPLLGNHTKWIPNGTALSGDDNLFNHIHVLCYPNPVNGYMRRFQGAFSTVNEVIGNPVSLEGTLGSLRIYPGEDNQGGLLGEIPSIESIITQLSEDGGFCYIAHPYDSGQRRPEYAVSRDFNNEMLTLPKGIQANIDGRLEVTYNSGYSTGIGMVDGLLEKGLRYKTCRGIEIFNGGIDSGPWKYNEEVRIMMERYDMKLRQCLTRDPVNRPGGEMRTFFIIGNSDAHNNVSVKKYDRIEENGGITLCQTRGWDFDLEPLGTRRTSVFLGDSRIERESILTALEEGRSVITEGPFLNFWIEKENGGNILIGDGDRDHDGRFDADVRLNGRCGRVNFFWKSTNEFGPVTRVCLKLGDPDQTVEVFSYTPQNNERMQGSHEVYLKDILPGRNNRPYYLRAEVFSEKNGVQKKCFTNPIWIKVEAVAPAAPTCLSAAIRHSPLRVCLSWIDNSNNEEDLVIERRVEGVDDEFVPIGTLPANTTEFTDFSVYNDSIYTYRVYARNVGGHSPYSNNVSVRITLGAPEEPTNLRVLRIVLTIERVHNKVNYYWDVTLAWDDNSSSENGFRVDKYFNGAWQSMRSYPPDTEEGTVRFTKQDNYLVRVVSFNEAGETPSEEIWVNLTIIPLPPVAQDGADGNEQAIYDF